MSSATCIPVYMASVLPGLENVAGNEIITKLSDAELLETIRGKIFFSSHLQLDKLMVLQTVDNLYHHISRFTMGPHKIHLNDLEQLMARVDFSNALEPAMLRRSNVTFAVNASRSGKHTYSRFDLSNAAVRGILAQCPSWQAGTPEQHKLEFRLDLMEDQGLLSLRLTPAAFRFRGERRLFSMAALRPPVAHALVWLSKPGEDDRFLDPFCGSGTIVAERAHYSAHEILGGDLSAEAASAAQQNVPYVPGLTIQQWDARNLPVDGGSVNAVVTNLPFGNQILDPGQITGLYFDFAKELKRILSPGGQAILLTDKADALQRAVEQYGFRCETLFQLSLKGLHPFVFRVTL